MFLRADGSSEPVPAPEPHPAGTSEPEPLGELTDEGREFAAIVARGLADDVVPHGPAGPLPRVVVRWFWNGDPAYLTLHVLAAADEQPPPHDAWYRLEWANEEREFERTDRVLARPDVARASATPTATLPRDGHGEVDGYAHVTAVEAIVAQLPAALAAAGVDLGERFAASAAHFEGWGALSVLEATAPPQLLKALADHRELPQE